MTSVADLELCKELYELSGWRDTEAFWYYHQDLTSYDADQWRVVCRHARPSGHKDQIPAYDLGYLLRKLPDFYLNRDPDGFYSIELDSLEGSHHRQDADTPENATAKLAIELFKSGVLKV